VGRRHTVSADILTLDIHRALNWCTRELLRKRLPVRPVLGAMRKVGRGAVGVFASVVALACAELGIRGSTLPSQPNASHRSSGQTHPTSSSAASSSEARVGASPQAKDDGDPVSGASFSGADSAPTAVAQRGIDIHVDEALDDDLFMAAGRVFEMTCSTVREGHTLRVTGRPGATTFTVIVLETEEDCSATLLACDHAVVLSPVPFNGNGGEEIILDDQTAWRETSYQYLYLYEYTPGVYICPGVGKLLLDEHVFDVVRIR
jgi:hypothetical protein